MHMPASTPRPSMGTASAGADVKRAGARQPVEAVKPAAPQGSRIDSSSALVRGHRR
jgi:hypothetical protein